MSDIQEAARAPKMERGPEAARNSRLPGDQIDAALRSREAGTWFPTRPASPFRSATAFRSCWRTRHARSTMS